MKVVSSKSEIRECYPKSRLSVKRIRVLRVTNMANLPTSITDAKCSDHVVRNMVFLQRRHEEQRCIRKALQALPPLPHLFHPLICSALFANKDIQTENYKRGTKRHRDTE